MPRASASRKRRSRFANENCSRVGAAVAQSTHVLTVVKPNDLIWYRSLPQRSGLLASIRSSIGARTLPPPYQTATGKKDFLGSTVLACETGEEAASAIRARQITALRI